MFALFRGGAVRGRRACSSFMSFSPSSLQFRRLPRLNGLLALVALMGATPQGGGAFAVRLEARNAPEGASHRLVWPTEPGSGYTVETSGTLAAGSWKPRTAAPVEARWLAQAEPVDAGAGGARFFRVSSQDGAPGGETLSLANPSFEFPANAGEPPFPEPEDWRIFPPNGGLRKVGVISETNSSIPAAAAGAQWLFLSGGEDAGAGGVVQAVGTAVGGQTYTVDFAYAENSGGSELPGDVEVLLQVSLPGGAKHNTAALVALPGPDSPNGFARRSATLTLPETVDGTPLDGLPMALVFRIDGLPGTQLLLDDVRLAPTEYTAHPQKRPNVVVFLTDDHRARDLERNGHPVLETPEIDRLAAEGVYFNQAYVTSAACTPSRASIFLGEWERKHGVTFDSQSALTEAAFSRSYPMRLRRAGYYTGYIGKNHVEIGKSAEGTGYESGVMERMFDFWYGNHKHTRFYPKGRFPIYRDAEADTQVEILEEGTMRFLENRPADRPFFVQINYNVPHSGGTKDMERRPGDPDIYDTLYRDQKDELPPPPNYRAAADVTEPKIPTDVFSGEYIPSYDYAKTRSDLIEHKVKEAQTVHGVDRMLGHVRAELERQGVADNTIIVFLSDHGIQHGEYGLRGKVVLYDPSIHIPLIVHDPRMPEEFRSREIDEFALNVDVAPTLLELCGLDVPDSMQGRSLVPLLRGDSVAWREDFFLENMFFNRPNQPYPRMEAVRSKDFKYIRYFDKANDRHHFHSLTATIEGMAPFPEGEAPIYEELFDLRSDPNESTNLAGDPEYAETLDAMRARCQELVTELYGDGPPDTYVWGL